MSTSVVRDIGAQLSTAMAGESRAGVRLAVRVRLIALAVMAFWVATRAVGPAQLYYLTIVAGFALLGVGQMVVSRRTGQLARLASGILATLDMSLLTLALVMPYPLAHPDWPVAMQLRLGNFDFFYLFIAFAVLGFPGPGIDSLYLKFRAASLAVGDSGFRAVIDYTDPPGVRNFYLWEMFVDGERVISVDPGNRWRVISRDEFYDGQQVTGYLPFDEEVVEPGNLVEVRQHAITEEAFRYYFAFFDQATGGGSPFSTPPASVRGNVANITRPEHRALGFFLATEVRRRQLVVPTP